MNKGTRQHKPKLELYLTCAESFQPIEALEDVLSWQGRYPPCQNDLLHLPPLV